MSRRSLTYLRRPALDGVDGLQGARVHAASVVLGPRACGARVTELQSESETKPARTAGATTRKALEHLQDLTKKEKEKLVHKYRSMPDL